MKHKAILKIVADIGMTVMLLFLMTYELIGEAAYEWLGIGHYMFLQNQYVFFDFEESLIFFLADYVAVMVLFVWVSHYFAKGLRYVMQKSKIETYCQHF